MGTTLVSVELEKSSIEILEKQNSQDLTGRRKPAAKPVRTEEVGISERNVIVAETIRILLRCS